jgi:hypothetical protein
MATFNERLVSILTFTPTAESDYVLLEAAATDAEEREIARLIHAAIVKAREEGEASLKDDVRAASASAREEEERADAAEEEARELNARVKELEAQLIHAPASKRSTDQEITAVFLAAEVEARMQGLDFNAADRAGALAVARHVRAEKCLVSRAANLGCGVTLTVNGDDIEIAVSRPYGSESRHSYLASKSAEAPAMLSKLLDIVKEELEGELEL